ncbi:MAG: FHA domain-containing protein [Acidobacteria bacterium]|nr:FHA domain-containing protein [Acidobacteriota bacterium]
MTLVGSEQESLAQKAERKTNSELTSALCLVVGGNPGLADVRFFTQLGQVTIGRSAESDLILDGGTVSRVHCVLKRVSSGYLVEDHSRNGTWVNGIRIRSCLLRDGDQLRIGPHLLRVELATARPTIQEAVRGTGSASLLPLEPNLFDTEVRRHPQIFVRGLEEGVTLSLCGAETRIGRHPSNDIKLNGDKVSRDHSLIRRTDTGTEQICRMAI